MNAIKLDFLNWKLMVATAILLFNSQPRLMAIELVGLRVGSMVEPLGMDEVKPRFSWKLAGDERLRAQCQQAYRIQVWNATGTEVWDSGIVTSAASIAIAYEGEALQPCMRYKWTVTAWDSEAKPAEASSWFETGLMDASIKAWEGAQWIGGAPKDRPLYADYLSVFLLDFTVTIAPGSERASFILAANDPRLMDANKNVFQLENGRNDSYFKLELDLSPLRPDGDGGAALMHVYRAGYTPEDDATAPVASFEISREVIAWHNRHEPHKVAIRAEFGQLGIEVDGSALKHEGKRNTTGWNPFPEASVSLNPMGNGHDYITLGVLAEIGFEVAHEQQARFSEVRVRHLRSPHNPVFIETLCGPEYEGVFASYLTLEKGGFEIETGAYQLSGGDEGIRVVADISHNGMPMLRSAFETQETQVVDARLYVTARGIYEVFLNGERIGNDYYNPGLSQYNRTHFYQTYDVTASVKAGKNCLAAQLGEGWWSGQLSFGNIWNHFGDQSSLLAKLVIRYEDGTRQVMTTNEKDWEFSCEGPIRYSSLNMGEVYDASLEPVFEGWNTVTGGGTGWKPACEVALAGSTVEDADELGFENLRLLGQIGENAGIFKTIEAISVQEVRPGVFVYDLGQNIVGVPRVEFSKGKAGTKVTLRYAEMLYPAVPASRGNEGMLMTENLRAAMCQDLYVQKDGWQQYQPHFTSHGFRYVEITGVDQALPVAAVKGVVMSSIHELTADFECSNPAVTQLWNNLVWSNIDNFLTIPTDCPQRNERMGWSGDINVFAPTAVYLSGAYPFLRRHMVAMRDTQNQEGRFSDIAPIGNGFGGVLWGSAGITVPWQSYLQYGDSTVLDEHYGAMKLYLQYLDKTLDPETGLSRDCALGDWLGPQNNQLDPSFLAAAYHLYDLSIMRKVAGLLGRTEDAVQFAQRYIELKTWFNRTFLDETGRVLSPYGGSGKNFRISDTQAAYAVGLGLEVFEESRLAEISRHLVAAVERENLDDSGVLRPPYSLMTGFIGTAWISDALSGIGRSDLAYRLLQNRNYPSWLYAVDQGATTIWERLNGYTVEDGFGGNNSMNSFNHYSFGAVGQWLVTHCLGIERGEPGFQHFILQPEPDPTGEMRWARGSYESPYGRIRSAWEIKADRLYYEVTVPANTTATLYLPTRDANSVLENEPTIGQIPGVRFQRIEGNRVVFELVSGSYQFSCIF